MISAFYTSHRILGYFASHYCYDGIAPHDNSSE